MGIYFAIDDVALYDLGCDYIPSDIFGNYSYNGQPHTLSADDGNVLYNSSQAIIDFGGGPGQAATYSFQIFPSFNTITPLSTYSARINLNPCPNCTSYRYGTVLVTKTYPGGCTTSQSYDFSLGYTYQYSYAPNPANDQLTVSAVEPDGSASAKAAPGSGARAASAAPSFEAALFNSFGQQVQTASSAAGAAVFDVRSLPGGLYTLRIGQGAAASSQTIQITH